MIKNFDEMKETLKKLCSIPSVQGDAEPGKPFGAEVYRALVYFLSLGDSFGFETHDYDGYVGEIVWRGTGKEEIAILCHLDVVKAGRLSDWNNPPFSPVETNGRIYARGTLDDKGPAVSILYVMKELKDEGFIPAKTIRFILGCNEETGWGCIDHYNEVAKMPEVGFSPDGNFPVIYAEKGIMHAKYEFKADETLTISGGEMANMVCDYAEAYSPRFIAEPALASAAKSECGKHGLKFENGKIESKGLAAHGSTPDCGKNAIAPLLVVLGELGMVDKSAYRSLFEDIHGLKKYSDETGSLTMSPDIITAKDGKAEIVVDFRYPVTMAPEKMEELAALVAPYTLVSKHQKPLYSDKNGFLTQTLLAIYNEETGKNEQPIAIGGGTYARALKNGVAFGPEFPGEDAPVHQPNEYITLENLMKMSAIYKRAVKELSK